MAQLSGTLRVIVDSKQDGIRTFIYAGVIWDTGTAKLVAAAFLALKSLCLFEVDTTASDLGQLSGCTQLSRLTLSNCSIAGARAQGPGSSPLKALTSLRELVVCNMPSALAAGATQLTSLKLTDNLMKLAAGLSGMSNLQQLELGDWGTNCDPAPAEALQVVLIYCPKLSQLTLHARMEQPQFEVLVKHAPQLTDFTCNCLYLSEDMSQSACSLKTLYMQWQYEDIKILAYLPPHSLEWVWFSDYDLQLPTAHPKLRLNCSDILVDSDNIPSTLRAALTNLERCPAWQQSGTTVSINIVASTSPDDDFYDTDYDQLLEALSAVASKHVQLGLDAKWALLDEPAVQKLGTALGQRLTGLQLQRCDLCDEFWAAVWAHLPGLQRLTLCDSLLDINEISQETLTSFCSHATHPLQLRLGRQLHDRLGDISRKLKEQRRARGKGGPRVTVKVIDG
jgi:hypothetical protein